MSRRKLVILLGLAGLVACMPQLETSNLPITERNIAAKAATMTGASVLDTDRYTPSAVLAGCSEENQFPIEKIGSAELKSAIEQAQTYSDSQRGLALMIVRNGSIIYENHAENVSIKTRTESFSMMKTVTALMTGIAIDKGIIKSIDDPVGDYLKQWQDDPRGQITLRQLLTMSSGLQHYPFGVPGGEIERLLYSTDINAVALRNPLTGSPGAVFHYNNVNSQLIGSAIDNALRRQGSSGFARFMQENLWCPLGNGEATLWLDRENGSPHYYAGLQATSHDWARIGEMIRNRGKLGSRQIVSEKWISEMLKPSDQNPAYGLHIWRGAEWQQIRKYDPSSAFGVPHRQAYLAPDVYFFDGFGGQRVYIIPSHNLTIVRVGEVSMTYDDSVIVNLILATV